MEWLKQNWMSPALWLGALLATFVTQRAFEHWLKAPVDRALSQVSSRWRKRVEAQAQAREAEIERLRADAELRQYYRHLEIRFLLHQVVLMCLASLAALTSIFAANRGVNSDAVHIVFSIGTTFIVGPMMLIYTRVRQIGQLLDAAERRRVNG